jgi:hypothetical protein
VAIPSPQKQAYYNNEEDYTSPCEGNPFILLACTTKSRCMVAHHKLPLRSGADFQPTSEATSSWSSRVCYSESSHVAWSFATTNIFWGNTLLQSTLSVVCTATYIYISCGMGYPHNILCHPGDPLPAIIFCILLVWISCNTHGFIMRHIKFATFGSVDFHNTKYFSCGKFRLQYTLWYVMNIWTLTHLFRFLMETKHVFLMVSVSLQRMLHLPNPIATVRTTMHGLIIQVLAKLWEQLLHDFFCNQTTK